jgi:hypothetical protein
MDRPTTITHQIKQTVIEIILRHPNFADLRFAQIISERLAIPIAPATINRLRQLAHFKFLPLRRRQKLTEIQRQQCYQFACELINGDLPTENLIFSDESRFCMGPVNRWVRRRRGEYEEGIFAETDKYPRISIHLWAAIGIGFKSRVVIFEETVNLDVYVEALESSGFLRMADERFGQRQWNFVQNSASCHTSASTLDAATFFRNGRPIRLISTRSNVSEE